MNEVYVPHKHQVLLLAVVFLPACHPMLLHQAYESDEYLVPTFPQKIFEHLFDQPESKEPVYISEK